MTFIYRIYHGSLLFSCSALLFAEGLFSLLCIPFALYYSEPTAPFLASSALMLVAGILLYSAADRYGNGLTGTRGTVIKIFTLWAVMIFAGTLPYFFSHTGASWNDILFESASGFTTTGLTVLKDVDNLPVSLIVWRSLTQWIGGLVTLFLFYSAFPRLNFGNYGQSPSGKFINRHAGEGPTRDLNTILLIYAGFTILETGLLYLGGTDFYQSLCFSLGTISLSSFSPVSHSTSMAVNLKWIMSIFMWLSGISYFLYLFVMSARLRPLLRDAEIRYYFGITGAAGLIALIIFAFKGPGASGASDLVARTISYVTSSGYFTEGYMQWPRPMLLILFSVAVVGSCSGTMGGGVKIFRFASLLKYIGEGFTQFTSSFRSSGEKVQGKSGDENGGNSVISYITFFLFITLAGIMALSIDGLSFAKSFVLALSSLSDFGIETDLTGISHASEITMSILMLMGRLELYTVILLLMPSTYLRKQHQVLTR